VLKSFLHSDVYICRAKTEATGVKSNPAKPRPDSKANSAVDANVVDPTPAASVPEPEYVPRYESHYDPNQPPLNPLAPIKVKAEAPAVDTRKMSTAKKVGLGVALASVPVVGVGIGVGVAESA